MKQVSLAEAKARLSALVADVEGGASVEISKRGKVVAMLVPLQRPTKKIDIERLRQHQRSLTSPVQDTDTELAAWKDENKY